jgi:hypothetical protein
MSGTPWYTSPHSDAIPFLPKTTDLVSNLTGDAIRELRQKLDSLIAVSASPGFTWGKAGSAGPKEYLLNDDVESNKSGRLVPFEGKITRIFVNNNTSSGNKTLQIRRRRPCQTGSWTNIAEVTIPNGDFCITEPLDVDVLGEDELAQAEEQISEAQLGLSPNNTQLIAQPKQAGIGGTALLILGGAVLLGGVLFFAIRR